LSKQLQFPNFIIGGAPKCGTSSLYFWLSAHPEAAGSKEKETFYFAPEENRFNRNHHFPKHGYAGYAALFEHAVGKKVVFEATAPYLYYPSAITGLAGLPEPPKVLFIVREPAARTLSQYLFERHRTGRVSWSFEEYLREPGIVDHGHYARYLQQWIAAFGRNKIKVVLFEEVMHNPTQAMQQLATWLGIDPAFYQDFDFTVRNETVAIKRKFLHRLGLRVQPWIPHAVQEQLLPLYLKANAGKRPQATLEERALTEQLKREYQQSNQELNTLFPELDLSLWK
jgi:hypothetical protein